MTAGGRLFAVGEAAASHGVYRPGGTALNAGQVGSTRAAQYIAARCRGDASAGFDAAASAALAEMAALADACRADTGNVRALWQHAAEEMSRCGAAIRDPAQIRAYGKQVEAQLADFAQTVKAGSRTELAMLYRLRDMLLSQRAYLTAMTDYTAHGGKSRGSALYTDLTGGVKPFAQLPDTFTFALDRAMIGAYGHDDRVDAYPALLAEIETKDPVHTTICVLTDKEEIGSDGVTGMQSMYVFHFMQLLCRAAGQDDILAFRNSVCLSADVTAAYDPSWASAFEKQNGTYAGRGIAIFKYTGSRGKSSASDANAELLGDITRMLDANNVAWQIGEMGRLDLGGGGTIAKYVANRGIKVLDMGVPVLSMHSPFEVIHKTDLYMAYRTFSVFCQSAD